MIIPAPNLTDYATKAELNELSPVTPTTISQSINSAKFPTSIPSLEGWWSARVGVVSAAYSGVTRVTRLKDQSGKQRDLAQLYGSLGADSLAMDIIPDSIGDNSGLNHGWLYNNTANIPATNACTLVVVLSCLPTFNTYYCPLDLINGGNDGNGNQGPCIIFSAGGYVGLSFQSFDNNWAPGLYSPVTGPVVMIGTLDALTNEARLFINGEELSLSQSGRGPVGGFVLQNYCSITSPNGIVNIHEAAVFSTVLSDTSRVNLLDYFTAIYNISLGG